MKIVYSIWTKPIYDRWDWELSDGEIDKLDASLNCLLLSVLLMKKYGFTVEVVTDLKGKEMIKDFPIDNILIALEDLPYNGKTWVEGKIKAIALQTEPFVHVDWDVFFLGHKVVNIINSYKEELIIQNREHIKMYSDGFIEPFDDFRSICENEGISIYKDRHMYAFCCGIIGFNNLKLRDKWVNEFKKTILVAKKVDYDSSLIVEQCLLYAVVAREKSTYKMLLKENNLHSSANKIGYTHLIFLSKYTKKYQKKIKEMIAQDFPEYLKLLK